MVVGDNGPHHKVKEDLALPPCVRFFLDRKMPKKEVPASPPALTEEEIEAEF